MSESAAPAAAAKPSRPLLTITPLALAQAKALLVKHDRPQSGFRVGVRGGGCSGLTYMLEFEDAPRKGDQVFEFDGVRIFMDIKSQLFLAGTTLDYTKSLMDTGFKFVNPNAKRSCSCGESFSV
jgi:iron-sulfur cluster assembly protein